MMIESRLRVDSAHVAATDPADTDGAGGATGRLLQELACLWTPAGADLNGPIVAQTHCIRLE